MSDYSNIKADCAKTHKGMETIIAFLQRQHDIFKDDPQSPYFDPDWTVDIRHSEIVKVIEFLKGGSGPLYHLGNEKLAAATLFVAHEDEGEAA